MRSSRPLVALLLAAIVCACVPASVLADAGSIQFFPRDACTGDASGTMSFVPATCTPAAVWLQYLGLRGPFVQVWIAPSFTSAQIFSYTDSTCTTVVDAVQIAAGQCSEDHVMLSPPFTQGPDPPAYPPEGFGAYTYCGEGSSGYSTSFAASDLGVCDHGSTQFCAQQNGVTYLYNVGFSDDAQNCMTLESYTMQQTNLCIQGLNVTCPSSLGPAPPTFPPSTIVLESHFWALNSSCSAGEPFIVEQRLADTCVTTGLDSWQLICPRVGNASLVIYDQDKSCSTQGSISIEFAQNQCVNDEAEDQQYFRQCKLAGDLGNDLASTYGQERRTALFKEE